MPKGACTLEPCRARVPDCHTWTEERHSGSKPEKFRQVSSRSRQEIVILKTPKPLIAVALCFALSGAQQAFAAPREHWFVAKSTGGALAYNATTLAPVGGKITLSSAIYLSRPVKSAAGTEFQFVLAEDRIDCAANKFKVVTRILLNGAQDIVEMQEPDAQAWQPISGNAVLAFLQGVVCNGETVANTREAASIDDALNLMAAMGK